MLKLSKLYESLIDEDYPLNFDMEVFKGLNNFNKRIKYCEANLSRISSGSSRIVYKIDDEKVLKLAKNPKGLAQNEVEIDYGNDNYIKDTVAKIFDYDENNLWVEMELARKMTIGDFKRITGYSFKDYANAILKYGHQHDPRTNRSAYNSINNDLYNQMWEDSGFAYDMFNFIGSYDLPIGDLVRLNSYGIVKRDGEDTVVLIDYGLTSDVYKSYY